MPACVECGFPTQNLVVVESRNKALKRCQNCTRPCDRFLEYDAVQLVLCLVLLVKEAFAHVLFNIPNVSRKLILVVIMSIALESYVVLVTTEYASFKRQHRDIISTTGSTSQNSGNILQTSSMSSMNVGITSLSPDITVTATTTGGQQESTAMQQLLYNLTGTSDAEASAAMLFGVKLLGSTLSDLVSSAIKPNCSGSSIGDDLHNPQNFTIIDGDALRNVNETLRGIRKILSSDITVQLVPVFKQYTGQSLVKVVDFSRLPVLLGYAIAEFGFVSLCSIWMAGLLYPRDTYGGAAAHSSSQQLPNGAFSAFFSATCLASGAKLLYVMFLVWQIPPYLISIAEVAAVGWTHAGFRACGLSSRSALVLLAGSILARCLVRSLTLWAPQLLMLEAMVLR